MNIWSEIEQLRCFRRSEWELSVQSLLALLAAAANAFAPATGFQRVPARLPPTTQLSAATGLEIVALVAGQENYGLAVVAVGVWMKRSSEKMRYNHRPCIEFHLPHHDNVC